MTRRLLNGVVVDLNESEINEQNTRITNYNNSAFDREISKLRENRNKLLAETDYLALSDQTLSAEMNTYRQQLRDLTNGLTTVDDVNNVVYPTKPEA